MQNPTEFYNTQKNRHLKSAKYLFKRLSLLSILRLGVFLTTATGIYFSFGQWGVVVVIAILGLGVFLFLLSKYTDLKSQRQLHKRLVKLNELELEIADGHFHDRPDGKEYLNPLHYYSLDIDLFGRGSFYQYINRTSIREGADTLSKLLLSNNTDNIQKRQEAIKELASIPEWRQYYSGISQGIKVESQASTIINWLQNYKPFLSNTLYKLTIVFSILSVAIILLGILKVLPITFAGYWLLIGLGITGLYVKRINHLSEHTSRAKDTFKQYALLLDKIENMEFTSQLLKEQQEKIKTEALKASQIFSKFSKALDALDNRNNLISLILGNGYLLWDIRQSYEIEKWISKYAPKVEQWFQVVTFFDAYNSFGNYVFNHPSYTFPDITEDNTTLNAIALGHPLLDPEKRVDSDMIIKNDEFFIVTGANMAGKSTFLRTVALHIVMANVGLPVCASQSKYNPIKLITSMRTTDSLTDDSSYFFSELTRLKFIVDTVEKDNNYFIILDEILKGTNSTDKAIGSRKFVEKLVLLKATGIIATHDLSLTEIEAKIEPVKNYFFDAQIVNDELFFDYKLKQGVCQNMNASFLLKKMDIV